jgi:hypothetical protein
MNGDSRTERHGFSLDAMAQRLRALSAVEPPAGLREKLLATVPPRATGVRPCRVWRWPGVTGWASVAATILVFCGILWLHAPTTRPASGPSPDANSLLGGVLAADYNSVRPADINTLDSNGLY